MSETYLNDELAERIFARMRTGVPLGAAAVSEGVPLRTARGWREKGEKPDAPEPYRRFAEGCEDAKAAGMATLLEEFYVLVEQGKNPTSLLDLMGRL